MNQYLTVVLSLPHVMLWYYSLLSLLLVRRKEFIHKWNGGEKNCRHLSFKTHGQWQFMLFIIKEKASAMGGEGATEKV
jgi:hypothetical protein